MINNFLKHKKKSNLICLEQPWRIGLVARQSRLRMSHHIIGVEDKGTRNLAKRDWSHPISVVVLAMLLYSTYVLEQAIEATF